MSALAESASVMSALNSNNSNSPGAAANSSASSVAGSVSSATAAAGACSGPIMVDTRDPAASTGKGGPSSSSSKAPTPGSDGSSAATASGASVLVAAPHPPAWSGVALATSEDALVSALSLLLTELNRRGSRLGLTKKSVLLAGRKKKSELGGSAWTKNVARLFGAVLKRTNAIDGLNKQRQEDEAKYGGLFGALQEFGNLHGEEFSTTRQLREGGLVPHAQFVSVECGGQHAVALTRDGRVFSWGAGSFGQLGNGRRDPHSSPEQVEGLPPCARVACGYAYSCVVSVDGQIYSWGAGENGRLGTGDAKDRHVPMHVETDWKAVNIFAGSVHTCAIAESGQMYTWGHMNYTGHGTGADVVRPKLLDRFDGKLMHSASIGPGGYHTIALSVSGDVYTWGHNRVGQLGFENEESTQITTEGAFFYPHPCHVRALSSRPVRQVAAGWGHSMVLCWDGAVLACGRNYRGQLGQDPSACTLNERGHPYCATFTQVQSLQGFKMEKIACGGEHSAAIAEDGSLYIWGDDSCGQLAHADDLCDVYGDDEPKSFFNPHAYRVAGEPSVQGVMDIALGSSVSFVITAEDDE